MDGQKQNKAFKKLILKHDKDYSLFLESIIKERKKNIIHSLKRKCSQPVRSFLCRHITYN